MSEKINLSDDPVQELRLFVMAKAVELTTPTGGIEFEDTARLAQIFPNGEPPEDEEGFPSYNIRTFHEGSQSDGAIIQVSFEDIGIREAHLTLGDDNTSYEEGVGDEKGFGPIDVDQVMARELLERFQTALQ